ALWRGAKSACLPNALICFDHIRFEALQQIRRALSRQYLSDVRLVRTFALPDLLGAPFFRCFPVFRSDRGGINELLRRNGCRKKQGIKGERNEKVNGVFLLFNSFKNFTSWNCKLGTATI